MRWPWLDLYSQAKEKGWKEVDWWRVAGSTDSPS